MRYAFANCVLDTGNQTLSRDGKSVAVEPQVFDLLRLLVENSGRLVSRDEIVGVVWKGRIVSESAISARIASARKAVGDDGKAQGIIRTISKRGLQIAAPVNAQGDSHAEALCDLPTPRVKYITSDDGIRLAYALSGEGTPVLRVSHGMSHLQAEWTQPSEGPLLQAISRRHRLLRMDERGTGLSDPDIGEPSLDRIAADLRIVADAAGLDRFAVYSESGGCFDAITFAATYPERVSKLVIIGGYADGRLLREGAMRDEPLRALMAEGWDTPESPLFAAWATAYFPEGPHDVISAMAAYSQRTANRDRELRWRDLINRSSVTSLLGRITAPTLIIHGQRDGVHPVSEARKLAAGIPDAELLVYDTANHVPVPGHATWNQFLVDFFAFLADD